VRRTGIGLAPRPSKIAIARVVSSRRDDIADEPIEIAIRTSLL
jgi:hypothetical protein